MMIPAEFRRVLDLCDPDRDPGTNPRVHVCYGDPEPWLTCWTTEAMDEIDAMIDEMDDGDEDRLALEEYFYEYTEVLRLDDAGRLVLPKKLRAQFGISDEAVFASRGKTFRIFSPDAPTEAVSALARRRAELPEGKSILTLLPSRKRAVAE